MTQEDLDESERFLLVTPPRKGSGSWDVSVDHDRYLFED
jgi:hypothetical protein